MLKFLTSPAVPITAMVLTALACGYLATLDLPAVSDGEIAEQIFREDTALCAKLGFPVGAERAVECETDLADLRVRHEKLLASRAEW